ncbi:MAG: hypothetical protein AAB800_04080 [Patescibacteria group bacterium]
MTTLKIENRQLPDSQYTLTYRDEYGIQTIESGVKKDDSLVTVRIAKRQEALGEPQVLKVTESITLYPGEEAWVVPDSYGERGAFILETVEAEQRMIVDGEELSAIGRTTINGVTIVQAND